MYNDKPIRLISNPHSKYNSNYYLNMKSAYKINQKILNRPSTSSSRGTWGTSIGNSRDGDTVGRNINNYNGKSNNKLDKRNPQRNPQGKIFQSPTSRKMCLAEYTATPAGEYTPRAHPSYSPYTRLKGPAEYTATPDSHKKRVS